LNFPTDSDEQCSGERTGAVAGSSHKELSFRTAKQRTHSVNKKQTSSMLEVDESHEVKNMFSSSHPDHQLPESDSSSGKMSEPSIISETGAANCTAVVIVQCISR
jgi:hypothetical protein